MAKLVAHLLATAALLVRIQTSLKNTKRAKKQKIYKKGKPSCVPASEPEKRQAKMSSSRRITGKYCYLTS
jgi:hypothetical protein